MKIPKHTLPKRGLHLIPYLERHSSATWPPEKKWFWFKEEEDDDEDNDEHHIFSRFYFLISIKYILMELMWWESQ
jgi:hypothetical protein